MLIIEDIRVDMMDLHRCGNSTNAEDDCSVCIITICGNAMNCLHYMVDIETRHKKSLIF